MPLSISRLQKVEWRHTLAQKRPASIPYARLKRTTQEESSSSSQGFKWSGQRRPDKPESHQAFGTATALGRRGPIDSGENLLINALGTRLHRVDRRRGQQDREFAKAALAQRQQLARHLFIRQA